MLQIIYEKFKHRNRSNNRILSQEKKCEWTEQIEEIRKKKISRYKNKEQEHLEI